MCVYNWVEGVGAVVEIISFYILNTPLKSRLEDAHLENIRIGKRKRKQSLSIRFGFMCSHIFIVIFWM